MPSARGRNRERGRDSRTRLRLHAFALTGRSRERTKREAHRKHEGVLPAGQEAFVLLTGIDLRHRSFVLLRRGFARACCATARVIELSLRPLRLRHPGNPGGSGSCSGRAGR